MNIPSYMLVISGTPDFFPIMDEVFSPIVRQFKKINVGEFRAIDDTCNCIYKPLERLGVDPKQIVLERDVEEIHNLSGGRPYEIQLICHVLFRRVQSKRAPIMKINFSVLEEVRLELETWQNIASRPILTKVRNLTRQEMSALNVLCRCNGNATIDQIWGIEYIFKGDALWNKNILEMHLHKFVNEGLLTIDNDLISFTGDDFDKIYIKYWAGEQNISLQFSPNTLEIQWERELSRFINRNTKRKYTVLLNAQFPLFFKDGNIVDFLKDLTFSNKDLFVDYAPFSEYLYMMMIQNREHEILPIIAINPHLQWLNEELYYANMKIEYLNTLDEDADIISSLSNRIAEIGGNLLVEKKNLPIVPSTILIHKVEHTKNEAARQSLASFHLNQMYEAYRNAGHDKASFEADLCYRYDPEPSIEISNSLGYVFLFTDDLERAAYLFNRAISLCSNLNEISDPSYPALPIYNLGIVCIERNQFEIALAHFQSCISLVRDLDTEQREIGWLWIPALENSTINLEEHNSPDLLDAAQKAKAAIEQLLANVNNGEKN